MQVSNPRRGLYYPLNTGTPVEADFVHHCRKDDLVAVPRQPMYNRFGFHSLRLVSSSTTLILQDMYSFKYRQYADLSAEQRAMNTPIWSQQLPFMLVTMQSLSRVAIMEQTNLRP